MSGDLTALQELRKELASGARTPRSVAEEALSHANSNKGRNVYISLDAERTLREADALPKLFPSAPKPLLYGLPVSIKDCFEVAGFRTTMGSSFYANLNGMAAEDSAVAARLRAQGAMIIGKTNLHELAYGITGENRAYGNCLQPNDEHSFTGGSSSGAAASVQEGSAVAAIGTDTGGSIRVPTALCGEAGYRASIELAHERGLWRGGIHLAPSFDTLGWLFRDVRDAPLLAEALFGIQAPAQAEMKVRVGCVGPEFLDDCELDVLDGFEEWKQEMREQGGEIVAIETKFWNEAMAIFAPVQAHEAAGFHGPKTGNDFSHFESSIAERLTWGASIPEVEVKRRREQLAVFRTKLDTLLQQCDFAILPCAPMGRLVAGADHSRTRVRILRYTAPMSLAGVPVVTLPARAGAGVQLAAARGKDARLLAYAAQLAENGRHLEK
jgi:Asp-tRNA(Asn)/Glu-tRNA(Gln) amidotransferase A subunit family amidase